MTLLRFGPSGPEKPGSLDAEGRIRELSGVRAGLGPAEIVTTGTPPGVGMGLKPEPWSLKPGEVMTLGIGTLGRQSRQVVAWPRTA